MITNQNVGLLADRAVYSSDGGKVGKVGQIWPDRSGKPAWASVRTGMFGRSQTLVPLRGADIEGERLLVPFDKKRIKHAPTVDLRANEAIGGDAEQRLYRHYGMVAHETRPGAAGTSTGMHETRGSDTDDVTPRAERRPRGGTQRDRFDEPGRHRNPVTDRPDDLI